jgi:hypothetical protein
MKTDETLSAIWIFAVLNYLYCDVMGLMDADILVQVASGVVDGLAMTPELLLVGSILMEIPIAMTLASRLLERRANRVANIAAGSLMTLVQAASLLVGSATIYYQFFSVIEISATLFIVWTAWNWKKG